MGSSPDFCSGKPRVQILFPWSTILTDVSRSFPKPIRGTVGIIPQMKLLAASLHRTWINVNAIDVLICSKSTITNAMTSTHLSATLRGGLQILRTLSAVSEWDSEALLHRHQWSLGHDSGVHILFLDRPLTVVTFHNTITCKSDRRLKWKITQVYKPIFNLLCYLNRNTLI